MNIKFGYTIVYVANVPEILDFYRRAFGFATKFLHEGNDYGELATGDTVIGFANHQLGKMNLPEGYLSADVKTLPLGMELVLVTDDVEQVYEQALTEGAIAVQPPQLKPWNQTVAYLRDPQGTLIELCNPIVGN
ncbi:MAG: VOC family protein [Cyanobacteria bacterium P01_A01_bin.40]